MRNFILAVIILGGLIAGTLLVLQEIEKKHANRSSPPIRKKASVPNTLPESSTNSSKTTALISTNYKRKSGKKSTEQLKRNRKHQVDSTAIFNFLKQFRNAAKKIPAQRKTDIPSGANAMVTLPYVVLRARPDSTGKQVALLYRGNELQITGKAVSNHYPCTVFDTSGYVPVQAVEKASRNERKRYRMTTFGTGRENPDEALKATVQALHNRNRMALIRMVFQDIRISIREYPTGSFRVGKETLRNISRHRNLDGRPYSAGVTLWQIFNWASGYLPAGSVRLKKNRTSFTWPEEGRFRLTFLKKGNRWVLSAMQIDKEPRP